MEFIADRVRGSERMYGFNAKLNARFTGGDQPDMNAFFTKRGEELRRDAVLQRHAGAFECKLGQVGARANIAAVAVSREFVDGVERFGKGSLVQRKTDGLPGPDGSAAGKRRQRCWCVAAGGQCCAGIQNCDVFSAMDNRDHIILKH